MLFLENSAAWVKNMEKSPLSKEVLDGGPGYNVAEVIDTLAKALAVLGRMEGDEKEEEYPFVDDQGKLVDEKD